MKNAKLKDSKIGSRALTWATKATATKPGHAVDVQNASKLFEASPKGKTKKK